MESLVEIHKAYISKAGNFAAARRAVFGANKAERAASAARHAEMVRNLPQVSVPPRPATLPPVRKPVTVVPMAERRARAAKKWDADLQQQAVRRKEHTGIGMDMQVARSQNPWR